MNRGIRTGVSIVMAIALAGAPAVQAVAAQETFPPRAPSATGSYLAGIEALNSLHTDLSADFLLQAAEADWDNPLLVSRTFLAYLVDGRVADAASIAQHVLELDRSQVLANLTLGTVALKQRRFASAEQSLAKIDQTSLLGITGAILQAWAQLGEGDADAAFATLDKVGQGGFDEFLVFHRAIMADIAGRGEQAVQLARQAYEQDPFVTRIAEAYIRILANAGDFDTAREVIASFDEEGVTQPIIEELREPIMAGRAPGLFADTVQEGAAEMFHGLGSALARDGSRELAVVFLQLARYLDPEASVISVALSDLLASAQRYEEANAILKQVPDQSPLKTIANLRIVENIDAAGDREQAIDRVRDIVSDHPDNVEALGVLGDLLRYDEQWAAASDAYTRLIDAKNGMKPRDWRFYYVRGITNERSGQWTEAEADFKTALQLNPDQPQVLNYLGYSWVDQGLHLDAALDMIEQAVELQPQDGYIIDSLGWAFYKLGRHDAAVTELERAVRLLPDDPEINDHLGDAYWQVGRKREATFQWRIAMDLGEAGEDVYQRASDKLANGLDPNDPTQTDTGPSEAVAAE